MPDPSAVEDLLREIAQGKIEPVYLVSGDLVLAEPGAQRLAQALAERAGCEVQVHRRPPQLGPLLADLRTYSLFAPAKVLLAVHTAVLADRRAAAQLIQEAEEVLPVPEGDLSLAHRRAASRLLQVLQLFQIDPYAGGPGEVIARLPAWVLEGTEGRRGGRRRSKGRLEELREGLAGLLEAARDAGLAGWAEGDLAELAAVIRDGLPPGHALVLAEGAVAKDHPVVAALRERQAVVEVGGVVSGRRGWEGLEAVAQELAEQTGVSLTPRAMHELARRTLRRREEWGSPGERADPESLGRFAAEYLKLANMVRTGRVDRDLVEEVVEDRGQEDVWKILDAVGEGRAEEALSRFRRLLASAEDPVATRLSFFALLAAYCRHLAAVAGLLRLLRLPRGEASYPRFKARIAGALQSELPGGEPNPLADLHPFRLHRAYLAACRLPESELARLPWLVLETEGRLKGESGEPDTALASLLLRLASG